LLMQSLNETLLERKVDAQYAALLVVLWEPRTGLLTLCNAGAEPPLVFRRGQVLKPQVEGIPIGMLEDRQYEEVPFQTEPGDMILFLSDGVGDQLNAKDEEFSRGRISRLLKSHGTEPPEAVAGAIFAELDTFRDGTSITDDQTVLAVKVSG
jgi:sigma-B regulation protein RsbU (phosphoserine phosphatase)